MKSWIPYALAFLLFLGGLFFLDRYLSAREWGAALDAALKDVREARALVERHPGSFGAPPPAGAQTALKVIIQQAGSRHQLSIAFLTESEKEIGKGQRERQALARLVNADHARVVAMLDDLERLSGGGRIRELHLRPSREENRVYQDVEFVLARRATAE